MECRIAGSTATDIALEAYQDTAENLLKRNCKYDPSRPAEPYLAGCVLHAAADIARKLPHHDQSTSESHDPIDTRPPHTEPDLEHIFCAIAYIKNATYQSLIASIVLNEAPGTTQMHEALRKLTEGDRMPQRIYPNLLFRARAQLRDALAHLETTQRLR
jgi:DNA-directed RNA polymerase specialized sigma24 family protein